MVLVLITGVTKTGSEEISPTGDTNKYFTEDLARPPIQLCYYEWLVVVQTLPVMVSLSPLEALMRGSEFSTHCVRRFDASAEREVRLSLEGGIFRGMSHVPMNVPHGLV